MDRTTGEGLNPRDIVHILQTHLRLWAVPAVVCAVLAAAYALVAPREWRATQALTVRAEAAGVSTEQVGRFSDLSEMKTLQETILELAKSPSVVQSTLEQVGPPRRHSRRDNWPTLEDIEDFREQVDMRPPGGAEFGKTEVFYLSVLDADRDRASQLVAALCRQLEHRMQQLRDQRAQGMVVELERTVAMAHADLAGQIEQLASFEAAIGPDLAELRNLNAEIGGQSEISQQLQAIETERRANETAHRENTQLLALLESAQADPQLLIATPSSLLRSQPALSRLKDALVDAQVRTAQLLGTLAEAHPHVIAAREAETVIRKRLHDELPIAIKGVEVDLRLNADREQVLAERYAESRTRLARLAASRAEYANLVASVEDHTKLVESARRNLADARARQAGARSASVISRIDGVEAGVRPVGLARKTIAAAGGLAGLALGFGLVFLVAPLPTGGGAPAGSSNVLSGDGAPCQATAHHRETSATCGDAPHASYVRGSCISGSANGRDINGASRGETPRDIRNRRNGYDP